MVDRLEAMLARWPVLTFLVFSACSVGTAMTTIAFLGNELTGTKLELSITRGEAREAHAQAREAMIRQEALSREIDLLNKQIEQLRGNAIFGRDKMP
jgi:hypothetical protein